MKKKYLIPAVVGITGLLLSGCAATANKTDPTGITDAKGENITVWIMDGTNPDSKGFFDKVSEKFEEKTGATATVEYVQWADGHDRFVTAIAGGTTPDVAETGTTWTAEFADAGALAPLDDYIATAELGDDLVEGLVAAGNLDGTQYGMPWYAGVRSIIYRADVFEELGLEPPTTWDEIVEAGTKIKEAKPEMTVFAVPGDAELSTYPWIWGGGAEVATLEGDQWVSGIDSPESIKGLAFYTGLATEHGFSTAGATTWKETDVLDNFAQGSVAMAIQGSWTPAALFEKNPDLEGKVAALTIPGPDGGYSPSMLGGSHLSLFETSKNKDLAWEFIEMMTTGEFAEEWAAQTGYFPGQESLMGTAVSSDDPLVAPFATQMVEAGATLPVTPKFGAVQAKKTIGAMVQSILSGQKSVETAAADAAAEMESTMNGN